MFSSKKLIFGKLQIVIGLLVSAACMAYVLRKVNFSTLSNAVLSVEWYQVVGVNLFSCLCLIMRSYRWRTLLKPVVNSHVKQLLSANLIGFSANNILPARLGEFVRVYVAGKLIDMPVATIFGTIIIEKVIDGFSILLVLFMTLSFADPLRHAGIFSVGYLQQTGKVLLTAYGVVTLAVVFVCYRPDVCIRVFVPIVSKVWPRGRDHLLMLVDNLRQGLTIIGTPLRLTIIIIQTLAVWAAAIGMYWVCLPAAGLPLNGFLACMAFCGGLLAMAVPSGPAMVGAFQLAIMWGLMLAGVQPEDAANYAMIYWAIQYLPLLLIGLMEMWRQGFGLSQVAVLPADDSDQ